MALVLLDRAKETTVVVGTTASAILLGAAPGYQSFAGVGNGNTTYYCIADQSGGLNWEVGLGTYTLATTIITRAATPLSSSNAGASVSFPAGTKDVFIVYPSSKGVWLDASGNAIGLGTPAAFVATNVTGLPLTTGVTGTLPATNGGTGVAGTLTGILYGNGTSAHSVTTAAQMLTGMGVANTTTSGYLSSTDWNTFNGKQAAGSYVTVNGALGTPSSGTLTNCTFPTLNQNTTGTASNITAYTINQSVGTANSPSFPFITTTNNLSIQLGGTANIGFYQDATNTAIRTTASGSIYMQNATGAVTYGYFNSNGLNANVQGNVSGSSGSCTGNAATATALSTASGSAPSYSVRAWVNFNGTGTVAIRASGNVSSITDNGGVGLYTINFTTAMPDANYAFMGCGRDSGTTAPVVALASGATPATGSLQITTIVPNFATRDTDFISVAIFR